LWKSGGGSGRVAPKQIKAKELTSHVASGELLRLSKLRKTKCCCGVECIPFERALGAKNRENRVLVIKTDKAGCSTEFWQGGAPHFKFVAVKITCEQKISFLLGNPLLIEYKV
jgi:hypothetical protein